MHACRCVGIITIFGIQPAFHSIPVHYMYMYMYMYIHTHIMLSVYFMLDLIVTGLATAQFPCGIPRIPEVSRVIT